MVGTVEVVAIVVLVAVLARWLVRDARGEAEGLRRWSAAAGISLTPEKAQVVARYLERSRRGRRLGALLGFISPWIYSTVTDARVDEGAWALTLMLVGYALGALAAEIGVHRARDTAAAAVRPRRLVDYLSRRLIGSQRALGVISLGLIVPYAIFQPDADVDLPSVLAIAGYAVGGASIAVLVEVIERSIVARRQSVSEITDVEIDDAMRSTSLQMVAGAGLALLIQFAGPLFALCLAAAIPGEAGGIVAGVTLVLALLGSIACWLNVAHPTTYRVGRPVRSAG